MFPLYNFCNIDTVFRFYLYDKSFDIGEDVIFYVFKMYGSKKCDVMGNLDKRTCNMLSWVTQGANCVQHWLQKHSCYILWHRDFVSKGNQKMM